MDVEDHPEAYITRSLGLTFEFQGFEFCVLLIELARPKPGAAPTAPLFESDDYFPVPGSPFERSDR